MKTKILVAIPCFNCEKQIKRVLNDFDPSLREQVDQVLVIDNQSSDHTPQAALEVATDWEPKKISVVRNNQNYGLGGSHKVAFLYALQNGFTHIAIVHGDHQANPKELKELLFEIEKEPELDAVLGARFMKQSHLLGYSLVRTLGNRALNLLYSLLTGRRIFDLGSGLNLFKVSALSDQRFLGFSNAFTFNMDLLLDFIHKNSQLHYYPISWSETDQISNAKSLKVGWITLLTLLRWRFNPDHHQSFSPQDYSFQSIGA